MNLFFSFGSKSYMTKYWINGKKHLQSGGKKKILFTWNTADWYLWPVPGSSGLWINCGPLFQSCSLQKDYFSSYYCQGMLIYLLMSPVKSVWETCRKGQVSFQPRWCNPELTVQPVPDSDRNGLSLPSKRWIRKKCQHGYKYMEMCNVKSLFHISRYFGDKFQNT